MATRYNKESVIKAMENSKVGYKTVTVGNQLIAYAGENYKTLVFTETEDGKGYTQRMFDELPKKYRSLFGIKEKTNKKGEIEYIAHCIEHGEKFIERFYAPKGISKALLLEEGQKLAQEWGGECYKVTIA